MIIKPILLQFLCVHLLLFNYLHSTRDAVSYKTPEPPIISHPMNACRKMAAKLSRSCFLFLSLVLFVTVSSEGMDSTRKWLTSRILSCPFNQTSGKTIDKQTLSAVMGRLPVYIIEQMNYWFASYGDDMPCGTMTGSQVRKLKCLLVMHASSNYKCTDNESEKKQIKTELVQQC